MYLDYAEEMAKDNAPMHMSDWKKVLNKFLRFNRKDILMGARKVSQAIAAQKAMKEYEIYDKSRIEKMKILELPNVEYDKK